MIETIEDLGFCEKGQGGRFVLDGALVAPNGRLPINTDGGGLCKTTRPTGAATRSSRRSASCAARRTADAGTECELLWPRHRWLDRHPDGKLHLILGQEDA